MMQVAIDLGLERLGFLGRQRKAIVCSWLEMSQCNVFIAFGESWFVRRRKRPLSRKEDFYCSTTEEMVKVVTVYCCEWKLQGDFCLMER